MTYHNSCFLLYTNPCRDIGSSTDFARFSLSGANTVDSNSVCPLTTNTYSSLYDDGLGDYTNMLTPNVNFFLIIFDYNVGDVTWGTFYYASLTLKTKGWCDAALTQLAVEECECTSTCTTPPTS